MKAYRQHHPNKVERILLAEPDSRVWFTLIVGAVLGLALAAATFVVLGNAITEWVCS